MSSIGGVKQAPVPAACCCPAPQPPVDPCLVDEPTQVEPQPQPPAPIPVPDAPAPAKPGAEAPPSPIPSPKDGAPAPVPGGTDTPPAPMEPESRADSLPGWDAAAKELAGLGWTAGEIAQLAEDPLDTAGLEAVLEVERERAGASDPAAAPGSESPDEVPGEPAPEDSGLDPEFEQVLLDYQQRYLQMGMPEELIGAYMETAAGTGDPAVVAAAHDQAVANVERFRAGGWFERFAGAGIDEVTTWQVAVGLGVSHPMTGMVMTAGSEGETRDIYNALVTATGTMGSKLGNAGLSLLPGGRALQYLIGRKPISGHLIDRSKPSEIGLAVLSALALIPAIRGTRVFAGRMSMRAAVRGALQGVDESRVVRGALEAAARNNIKVTGSLFRGENARTSAGIALARDVERNWIAGGGRAALEGRIASLADDAAKAAANGASKSVLDGFEHSIQALRSDIKNMDSLLDDFAAGTLLPQTEKAPWVPRIMGRFRSGRDVVDYGPASYLRSIGAGSDKTFAISGKVKEAGVQAHIDKVYFSRLLRVGTDADVTTAHTARAAWQRAMAPEGRFASPEALEALGVDASKLGVHAFETVPGFGVGRVGEALGLAERAARPGTNIIKSPIEDAIRASWQVRHGYDTLRAGRTLGLHGNVGVIRIDDVVATGPSLLDPSDPARLARLGQAPAADTSTQVVRRAFADGTNLPATAVLRDAAAAADDALGVVTRAQASAHVSSGAGGIGRAVRGAIDDAVNGGRGAANNVGAAADDVAARLQGPLAREPRIDARAAVAKWLDAHEGYRYVPAHARKGVWQPATFQAKGGYAGLPVKSVDDEMRALLSGRPDLVWQPANSQAAHGYFAKARGWGATGRQQAFEATYTADMRDSGNRALREAAERLGIESDAVLLR